MISGFICETCGRQNKTSRCKYCYRVKVQQQYPKIPCACGCGEMIYSVSVDWRPVKFKKGHSNRGRRYYGRQETKECECGCGELIPKINKGGFESRFKKGHNVNGELNYFWNGGIYIDKDGYVLIKKRDHPFCGVSGYVRQHRLVMEDYLGRYLKPEEVVHHINELKWDNRIENLQLFESGGKHISLHMTKDMSDRKCFKCGTTDTMTARGYPQWFVYDIGYACPKCNAKMVREAKKLANSKMMSQYIKDAVISR